MDYVWLGIESWHDQNCGALQALFLALSQTYKGSISFKEFQAAALDQFWLDDFSTLNSVLENVSSPNENPSFLSVDSLHSQLLNLGLEIRKDALEEMTNRHDSMGNACFSKSNLEVILLDFSFPSLLCDNAWRNLWNLHFIVGLKLKSEWRNSEGIDLNESSCVSMLRLEMLIWY